MEKGYTKLDASPGNAVQGSVAMEGMMRVLEQELGNVMPQVEELIREQIRLSLVGAYNLQPDEVEPSVPIVTDVVSRMSAAQLRQAIKKRTKSSRTLVPSVVEPVPSGGNGVDSPFYDASDFVRSSSAHALLNTDEEYSNMGITRTGSLAEVGTPRPILNCSRRVLKWIDTLEEPPRKGCLHDFIHSSCFQQIMAVIILFNAWESAYAAEYELRAGVENAQSPFIQHAELSLYFVYLAELLVKLWVHGPYFFCNSEWRFNNFDFFLMAQFSNEMYMTYYYDKNTKSMSFMRTFRFLRVARALRVIRAFRAFEELATLLESLGASLYSFIWMLAAIYLIVALFGLISLQGATTFILTRDADDEMVHNMRMRFGSLYRCILSTYKAGTGGQSWEVFYDLMEAAGPVYAGCFLVFIAFFSLSVVNIITGMMVENVMRISQGDKERHAERLKQEKFERCENFKELIYTLDKDGSGTISWDEFVGALIRPDSGLHSHFAALELDIKSCNTFFQAMTRLHNSDYIPVDAFVDGCMRMAGTASSMDVHLLSCQLSIIHEKHMELLKLAVPEKRMQSKLTQSMSRAGTRMSRTTTRDFASSRSRIAST